MSESSLEVFLSHASSDREHVELVRGQIEAMGVAVYLSEHDPQAGTLLADKVDAAIRRASLVVVLITSTSVNSTYVQQEIGVALGQGKPVIPIVDSRIAAGIDLAMLNGVEYIIFDLEEPAEAMRQITARLQALVAPQLPAMKQATALAPITVNLSDAEKLFLLGALALLALLFISEGGAGSGS